MGVNIISEVEFSEVNSFAVRADCLNRADQNAQVTTNSDARIHNGPADYSGGCYIIVKTYCGKRPLHAMIYLQY